MAETLLENFLFSLPRCPPSKSEATGDLHQCLLCYRGLFQPCSADCALLAELLARRIPVNGLLPFYLSVSRPRQL